MHRLVVWLALLLGHVAALAQIPDLIGEWGPVLNWGYQGKHMALLPTDKVLVFRTGDSSRVWDPVANEFTQTPFLFGDLHCAAQVSLADGRVLVIPEIDAPEKGQPYGSPAKQALSDLVFGKVATVREQTRDRYGRTVGRVYVDGRDMNRSPRKPFGTGATTSGIWLSTAEIMALPMSGAAWNNVLTKANSSWGSADLSNLDAQHDVLTLAGALVAVRANDTSMRNKTITGLQSAMVSPLSGTLGLARGLQSYVIAADIIGYRTPRLRHG